MLKVLLAAVLFAIAPAVASFAGDLSTPKGKVVLTIKGAIANTNSGKEAVFDLEMLEAAEGRSFTTRTPWAGGTTTFEGPYLRSILDMVGARGSLLRIKALNDYAADVPVQDAKDYDTILATKTDGERMSVRDKGPVFLVYPFDTNPELYNEKYFSRSVWQIKEIEVIE